jgi:hypothetical protein
MSVFGNFFGDFATEKPLKHWAKTIMADGSAIA